MDIKGRSRDDFRLKEMIEGKELYVAFDYLVLKDIVLRIG